MRQIKTTTTDYLFQSTLYLISALGCTLLLLFLHLGSFSSRGCLGWRLSPALPPFSSQISFDEFNLAVMSTDSSIFLHTFRNFLAIQGLLIHREIKRQNRETVSWHPKPWVSLSNREDWKVWGSNSRHDLFQKKTLRFRNMMTYDFSGHEFLVGNRSPLVGSWSETLNNNLLLSVSC